MSARFSNPVRRLSGHIPRNRLQLEAELRNVLKLAFWLALLAPVILLPAYYLLVAFGFLPPLHLPPG